MRKNSKRMVSMILAGILAASALTGCEKIEETQPAVQETAQGGQNAPAESGTSQGESQAQVTAEEQWAIDAGLYEDESSDELYQKALEEEGG